MSRRIGQCLMNTWIFHNNNRNIDFMSINVGSLAKRKYSPTGNPLSALTNFAVLKRDGWRKQGQVLCSSTTAAAGGGESHSEMTTKRTLKKLQDVLFIDLSKAVRLVKKYPAFKATSMTKINDTIKFLDSRKVGIQRIRNNPWLLLMAPDEIEKHTKTVMSTLKVDFPVAVPFCKMSRDVLVKIAVVWKSKYEQIPRVHKGPYAPQPKNRLEYLACRLECSVEDVADMMAKVTNIATSPIDRLDRVMKLLLEAEIPTDAIVSDPWTFDNQLWRMEDRINICREKGCNAIKPWILRAPLWKFESYITRTTEKEDSPKNRSDTASFLQNKLGCSESEVQAMLRQVPTITNKTAAELCEIINCLNSKGFDSTHIIGTPRVLGLSVNTISKRLENLSTIDCVPDSLEVVCQPNKRNNNLIKRMTKADNKSTSCEA